MIWLVVPWMAFWSRSAGGGHFKLPWILDQILYAIPSLILYNLVGWLAVVSYVFTVAGKLMGTRQYLDMGYNKNPIRKPNNVDFLIRWLKPKVSDFWYDATGNAVIGIVSAIPTFVILLAHGYLINSLIILLAGAARGLAYIIGWKIIPKYHNPNFPKGIQYATEIAEYLSGAFAGIGKAAAIVIK